MSKLELFFTGLFVVGTVVVMILIYFYNVRHKLVIESDIDDYEVETKPGEKAIVEADENFDWDLYESDLKHDYDKFVGYDIWKSRKSAEKRIAKLREEFESGVDTLKINMFESMMLIDRFADSVSLDEEGVYRINTMLLSEFLKDLDYNPEMIEKIEELKDELDFSVETYEIDARKIFYIMRNASKLGVNNFNSHSQVFLFAKNNKKATLEAEIVGGGKNDIGELELYIENFDSSVEDFSVESKEDILSKKDEILSGVRNIMRNAKVYFDEDGQRIIEYPNGQKLVKKNLWDVNVVDEEDDRKNTYNEESGTRREKFSDIIKERSADEIMFEEQQNLKEKSETAESHDPIEKNVSEEKIKIVNEKIINAKFYVKDRKKVPIVDFFGEVESIDEYMKKLDSLDATNKKVLMILLLSIDAAKVEIDKENIDLIVESAGIFYISHEWILLVFSSMLANRNSFLIKNAIVNKSNYTASYSSEFIKLIIEHLDNSELPIFKKGVQQKYKYFKNQNGLYIATSLFELSSHAEHLLSTYNSPDKLHSVKISNIEKKEFKEYAGKTYSINFNSLIAL
ncbi:hypothetical protein [Sulfurimonas sp.]